MRPAPSRRLSPRTRGLRADLARAAYAALLRAHRGASVLGQPLLTDAGVSYVRRRARQGDSGRPPLSEGDRSPVPGGGALPFWDAGNRRFWWGEQLLKVFRQPAPNQTMILDVFQEQGWEITHADDPLPRAANEDDEEAKRRLHDTIKNLNRGLPPGTIRFRGDGTGQAVIWEYSP
jgi:hypothetical protein